MGGPSYSRLPAWGLPSKALRARPVALICALGKGVPAVLHLGQSEFISPGTPRCLFGADPPSLNFSVPLSPVPSPRNKDRAGFLRLPRDSMTKQVSFLISRREEVTPRPRNFGRVKRLWREKLGVELSMPGQTALAARPPKKEHVGSPRGKVTRRLLLYREIQTL